MAIYSSVETNGELFELDDADKTCSSCGGERELSLTNPTYAGRQEGKTDRLRRVASDCRTTPMAKQEEELEADALEAETLGFGNAPGFRPR